jgi:hypothetical protein
MIDRFGFSHLALANRLDLNWLQEAASERSAAIRRMAQTAAAGG